MSRLCKHCRYNDAAPAELWCPGCLARLSLRSERYTAPLKLVQAKRRMPATWRAKQGTDLTDRDRDVLLLLTQGLSNKQVAECLGLAEKSIDNRRASIMDRTGCSSAVQLGVWAERNGYAPRSESQAVSQ